MANLATKRKHRYADRHRLKGLCIECPDPVWDGRIRCKRCTLRRRESEKRQTHYKSKNNQKRARMGREINKPAVLVNGRASIWSTPV